ncbi:MAG: chromosomal replication initiator protein DnaA [Defluviitaleaceae bacterium]|nr:chromosomal replication initiator protein DnaA [Defluviitaleaceae bacterium]
MNEDINIIWSEALTIMKTRLTDVVFNTWIKTLEPIFIDEGLVILQTTDNFYKATIESRYLSEISQSIQMVTGAAFNVKIVSIEDINKKTDPDTPKPVSHDELASKANLKPRFIFETFVRGKSNELAYAAAEAVANAPGQTSYNPLFLYGGVGLGKTHLMQAIGNFILEQDQNAKILYVSAETFTNEFVDSIRNKTNQSFRNKYRDIDVFLVDDIQFVSEKEGTQEEFFHTFNTLYDTNRQIVITSDQPPKEIKGLEERLRSRFGCGLTVDVTAPDFETRMAILQKKAELDQVDIPVAVMQFIAKNFSSNIRDLEGALNKVTAYSRLSRTEITLDLVERSLKDLITERAKRVITVEVVQDEVCQYFGITKEDICGKKRSQNISHPRQIAMYLSRKIIDISFPKIGLEFGGKDHATVIHGCNKIEEEMEKDGELKRTLYELEKIITEG